MLMTSSELTSGVPDFVLKCTSLLLALVMAWFSFGSCESMTQFARYLAKVSSKNGQINTAILNILFCRSMKF